MIEELKAEGYSNVAIGEVIGVDESTIRGRDFPSRYQSPYQQAVVSSCFRYYRLRYPTAADAAACL